MLGKVSNRFEGDQILINWLEKNFYKLPDDAMEESWAWWRIPFLRPRVADPYTFLLLKRWNHESSYMGLPNELEDVRLF
ncbi:hypothetical protein J1N35_011382 [Gossypium stocksii]|uniref:Uncharacterized protein n=1 Tax=Gossypium stocksii TaxID=47602 RepID=A0A9D3W2B4_9ROSI|nr:hypothetical protein J1N35_011382 [Gossypium stocksii]